MKLNDSILGLLILTVGCTSWKSILTDKGDENDIIHNAVQDFVHSYKNKVNDSTFFIYTTNISADILGVSFYATKNKVLISTEDSITYSYRGLPTNYLEQDGRLFYWNDSTKTATNEIITTLKRYNHLDTMIVGVYIPTRAISHDKGVDYYFCRNNLLEYKKVRTKAAIGRYTLPSLNCR